MKVSVCLFTYNHAPYIAQAIDSALMQKTDFDFEIVIADDASTDGTRDIVETYARLHPGRVRPLLQLQNVGAGRNSMDAWKACRGQYIALLDGDDYWTHPQKLHRQAQALDAHPGWTMCAHWVRYVREGHPRETRLYPFSAPKEVMNFRDLLSMTANPIQTCSAMYRAGVVPELPAWFRNVSLGDWAMHFLHAAHGKVGFLDGVMADYRIHDGGAWFRRSTAYREEKVADMFHQLGGHLSGYARYAMRERSRQFLMLAALHRLRERDFAAASTNFLRSVRIPLGSDLSFTMAARVLGRRALRWIGRETGRRTGSPGD